MHNPNYVAYARAHNKTPDEMLAHDKIEWPGGCMVGFMLWIQEQKNAFREVNPGAFYRDINGGLTSIVDYDAWGHFLQTNN